MKKVVSRVRKQYHLTRQGVVQLTERLRNLQEQRKMNISRLKLLRSQQAGGKIAEDSVCIQTVSTIHYIEAEIERVENTLANADVMVQTSRPRKRVDLGSTVRLSGDKGDIVYTIVPTVEADPSEGKISDESPIGRLLLGKKVRDFITLPRLLRGGKSQQKLQLVDID